VAAPAVRTRVDYGMREKAISEVFDYVVIIYTAADRHVAAELKRRCQRGPGFMIFENQVPKLEVGEAGHGRCQLLLSLHAQDSNEVGDLCQQFLNMGHKPSDVWPCMWKEPLPRLPLALRSHYKAEYLRKAMIALETPKLLEEARRQSAAQAKTALRPGLGADAVRSSPPPGKHGGVTDHSAAEADVSICCTIC